LQFATGPKLQHHDHAIWKRAVTIPRRTEEISSQLAGVTFPDDCARIPRWKRALDISLVLIAIPSLLPMLLIIITLIKARSKGPVLFKQERVGFLGKRFILYKFRTMIQGADTTAHEKHVGNLIAANGPMTKLDARGDERLIPVGRLLRAAGLDELPQLINVLRGEMSLVGPRPCLPSEYAMFLPWQRERFRTLPGLTGLWQVSGKNRTTFNEMIDFDIRYLRKQSLWVDLKILLKTIPTLMVELKDVRNQASTNPSLPVEAVVGVQGMDSRIYSRSINCLCSNSSVSARCISSVQFCLPWVWAWTMSFRTLP
jgi:lipopolysaccharide/colanic/teichoic acid biosynthesis glycosyltransferase